MYERKDQKTFTEPCRVYEYKKREQNGKFNVVDSFFLSFNCYKKNIFWFGFH